MSPLKITAIVLIAAGVIGLAYGSFTYTSDSHDLDLGVTTVAIKEKETVTIPIWAGVVGIAAGVALLFARKSS